MLKGDVSGLNINNAQRFRAGLLKQGQVAVRFVVLTIKMVLP